MRTTVPSTRRARALLTAVGATAAAVALSAVPAGAAPGPPGTGPIATPNLPRPCVVVVGCRDIHTFPVVLNDHSVFAGSTFPQGSTGWVRYTLTCPDGFTKTALVTISGTRTSATLSLHGEHPVSQTCNVTQNVAASYNTVAYLAQPDPDELWASRHVEFFNVPKY
jgi:hypothetical protein